MNPMEDNQRIIWDIETFCWNEHEHYYVFPKENFSMLIQHTQVQLRS